MSGSEQGNEHGFNQKYSWRHQSRAMKSAGKVKQNRGLEKDENSEKFSIMNEF